MVLESTQHKNYQQMLFVEFLEFVARLASEKFKTSEEGTSSLAQKIEDVLDDLLPNFGMVRNEVNI